MTNLDKVVARARAGERIRVTYRSKPAFTITPEVPSAKKTAPGSREAVQRFLVRTANRKGTSSKPAFDPNKSVKELYHQNLTLKTSSLSGLTRQSSILVILLDPPVKLEDDRTRVLRVRYQMLDTDPKHKPPYRG
ncbi:MAG TPA: hypothetical protein VK674_05960 [Candidatus Limnocylindria bacterium]|nr:hypothetical protein [Candidatus Limnocylindria bacterium]